MVWGRSYHFSNKISQLQLNSYQIVKNTCTLSSIKNIVQKTVFRTVVLLFYNLHLNIKGSSLKETKHDSCLFFILFQVQVLTTPKIATKKDQQV
mgnify:CR=1 FL=1